MDAIVDAISARKEERGITLAELARRTGIEYDALRMAMRKERNLRAGEFVCLCRELGMTLDDFEG